MAIAAKGAGGLVIAAVLAGMFTTGDRDRTPPSSPPQPRAVTTTPTTTAHLPTVAREPVAIRQSGLTSNVEPKRAFVSGDRVNVRSGPASTATVLFVVQRGEAVTLIGSSGAWTEIDTQQGRGWVSTRFLADEARSLPARPEERQEQRPSVVAVAKPQTPSISDDELKEMLVAERRARYSGCACPDDRDRAGRRCGARSAYSKPGGAQPICYPDDVTEQMVAAFKAQRRASR